MQISKWRFLIIFWLLAVVFLVGEFWFLRWRKEKLYNQQKINEMASSINMGNAKIDNICDKTFLINSSNIYKDDLVTVSFGCINGDKHDFSLYISSLKGDTFGDFVDEIKRLTQNDRIFDANKWVCKLETGFVIDINYVLKKKRVITCDEI